jgi:hypothetical protein
VCAYAARQGRNVLLLLPWAASLKDGRKVASFKHCIEESNDISQNIDTNIRGMRDAANLQYSYLGGVEVTFCVAWACG